MINGGYILQPRMIENSDVMKMPPATREIWFYLLRNVNHKEYKNIPRGSGFFQYNNIQESLAWHVGYRIERYSKSQITKSLRRLCESNMIETTKETRGVVVTICKYEYYQDPENYEGNDEGNTKETRRKSEGSTINKNGKNVKNEKNKILIGEDLKFKKSEIKNSVENILISFSHASGTNYQYESKKGKTKNAELIEAVLTDYSEVDILKTIDFYSQEWNFTNSNGKSQLEFVRPSTICANKSRFQKYYENAEAKNFQSSKPIPQNKRGANTSGIAEVYAKKFAQK